MKTEEYTQLYDGLRSLGYHKNDEYDSHLKNYVKWIITNCRFNTVLDIGCSTGGSLYLFEKLKPGCRASGVDVSRIAIRRGKKLGRNTICASATRLPFTDNSFDLVVSSDTFEHLEENDAKIAIREACRVTKSVLFMQISPREDVAAWKTLVGKPLHLTIHNIYWWLALFQTHFRPCKILKLKGSHFCLEKFQKRSI